MKRTSRPPNIAVGSTIVCTPRSLARFDRDQRGVVLESARRGGSGHRLATASSRKRTCSCTSTRPQLVGIDRSPARSLRSAILPPPTARPPNSTGCRIAPAAHPPRGGAGAGVSRRSAWLRSARSCPWCASCSGRAADRRHAGRGPTPAGPRSAVPAEPAPRRSTAHRRRSRDSTRTHAGLGGAEQRHLQLSACRAHLLGRERLPRGDRADLAVRAMNVGTA